MPAGKEGNEKEKDKEKGKWGDEEEGKNTKTIEEVIVTGRGKKAKRIKKVKVVKKVVRKNKLVEQRKKWKKFGDCKDLPPGPERGVTNIGDEVALEIPEQFRKQKVATETRKEQDERLEKTAAEELAAGSTQSLVDRMRMAREARLQQQQAEQLEAQLLESAYKSETPLPKPSSSGYVVPALRGKAKESGTEEEEEDKTTLRVTNLSEDVDEDELRNLFRPFGNITRFYLAREKKTGAAKGFAFVSFAQPHQAEKAMNALQNHGLNHLILNLEWAKPSSGGGGGDRDRKYKDSNRPGGRKQTTWDRDRF